MEKAYHHGNLKEELIKAGVKIINKDGVEKLSLRQAASMCKVSHNAPYSHFRNKGEYLNEIKKFVEDSFSNILLQTIEKNGITETIMMELAKAYVKFFHENPSYFQFILGQEDLDIQIGTDYVKAEHFRPFQIFKEVSEKVLNHFGISKEEQADRIVAMWIMVQGITVLTIMPGVTYEGDWEAYMEHMLKNIRLN